MSKGRQEDIVVFDAGSALFVRMMPGATKPRVATLRSYRLPAATFEEGGLTPALQNEEALAEIVRRMKVEAGKLDRVSILLPDSWFRIAIVEVGTLPRRKAEADDVVKWTLKRTTPHNPAELRTSWMQLGSGQTNGNAKVLVVSALARPLAAIESVFTAMGVSVGSIESTGLNLWNAIVAGEAPADGRLLVYLRNDDFTTALFRGAEPVFYRSRTLSGDRKIDQEIRLSASFLKPTLDTLALRKCYVAGDGQVTREVLDLLASEFGGETEVLTSARFADTTGIEALAHIEAELIACRGVLTS